MKVKYIWWNALYLWWGLTNKLYKHETAFDHAKTLIDAGAEYYDRAITVLEQKNPGLHVERDSAGVPFSNSLADALVKNRKRVIETPTASRWFGRP